MEKNEGMTLDQQEYAKKRILKNKDKKEDDTKVEGRLIHPRSYVGMKKESDNDHEMYYDVSLGLSSAISSVVNLIKNLDKIKTVLENSGQNDYLNRAEEILATAISLRMDIATLKNDLNMNKFK